MKTTRFTDEQIIGFLKQPEAGVSIKDICRSGGFSQPTFYKWHSSFGGMEASDAAKLRGYPLAERTDNGPEFTSRDFMAWASAHGVHHILTQPGKPMQNGCIESFSGKFRDDCLNEQ